MSQPTQSARRVGAVAAAVAGVCALITAPVAATRFWFSPDVIEHLAIANAWVHGAGFVDPVQWAFRLDGGPPLPAVAVRPPVVPFLAALPLALGANLTQVLVLHALWASAVAGACVWVASRFLRLPFAALAGLLVALSPGWLRLSVTPLTEVTASAAYLAVLASAPGVLRSLRGALPCALATGMAWLVRPNLAALVAAVVAAAAWEVGPRAALRRPSLWAYVGGCGLFWAAAQALAVAVTGHAVYSGYDAELLDVRETRSYSREAVGALAFLTAHTDQIGEIALRRLDSLARGLFFGDAGAVHWMGWLALPGVVFALARPRGGRLEHRVNAFAALGFALLVVLNYAGYTPRYLLLPALAGGLCGLAMLDAVALRAERRLQAGGRERAARALPAALVLLALVLVALGPAGRSALQAVALWSPELRAQRHWEWADPVRSFCPHIEPDARVAARDPWLLHAVCGNPVLRLPKDLAAPALRERYLAERHPAYFLAPRHANFEWLASWAAVREVARSGRLRLYAMEAPAPESRLWKAPPPLFCAGRGPDCQEGLRAQPEPRF